MNRKWKISQYCENPPRYDLSHCLDACAAYEDGEVCAMALCDGSETGSLAHIGAACIAEFSAKYFAENFDILYNGGFNVNCEELIKYHQAMISNLAEVALEKKNVQILINRNIQIRELNKFAASVQVLAIKGDGAVYFKVGNGSAVIATHNAVFTLSDSVKRDPAAYVTTPNPFNLLISCDFQKLDLSDSCYAIALATDGVEFENGLFYGKSATPFYEQMLDDVADGDVNAAEVLQEHANSLLRDNMNTLKDNVGISIMHRPHIKEDPFFSVTGEPAVNIAEDCAEEELVEEPTEEEPEIEVIEEPAEEEPEIRVIEESAEEEPEIEVIEEPAEEESEIEAIEEPAEEEPEIRVIEEPAEEESEIEVIEEPVEEEPEIRVIEEPAEEEPEIEVIEEPAEEEPEIRVIEESAEEEPEIRVIEESAEEEPEIEVIEEPAEEEPEIRVIEESAEEEPVEEEPEIRVIEESAEEEPEIEVIEEPAEEEPEIQIIEESTEEEPEIEVIEEPAREESEVLIVTDPDDAEVEFEIVDDEDDSESIEASVSHQEKKVSKTFLKFFNVSIKKK